MTKTYTLHTLKLGQMDNFIYLIEDHHSGRGAVVDPAWDAAPIEALAKEQGFTLTDVLLTHSHGDHVNALPQLLANGPLAIHLHQEEADYWSGGNQFELTTHSDGAIIWLGETEIKLLHTPGHTPGSACFHLGDDLISGDTLFVFGCGRCDMPGGSAERMFNSLQRLTSELPDNTTIHPGHEYSVQPTSTLAEEIAGNPFLHFDDLAAFTNYRLIEHDQVRNSPYGPIAR